MHSEVYQFILSKLKLRLIILLASLLMLILSYYIKHEINVVSSRYSTEYTAIKSENENMQLLVDRIENSINLWNSALSKIYAERKGVEVNFAKQKIYDLRKKYGFKNFAVSITDPNMNKNFNTLKYVALESSILNMTFKAESDVEVVKFISDFKNSLPGILSDLYMEMRLEPTSGLLDVKLVMLWQNFVDKKNDE
ncbi:MAG: hypothetical protein ACK5WS_01440 [Alphaproteobacteria bacterium]|jgi:hypothetical protein|nr:hypothetical protein [Candidatus Jidaibacter sp.]